MKFRRTNESNRPAHAVTPAQVRYVASGFPKLATAVDPAARPATLTIMKLRHRINKLSRLNLTKADREIAALKDQFRKEDAALRKLGHGAEIALRNRRLMGLEAGEKTRLVGFGGVRFE